jgi:hypothetical protein
VKPATGGYALVAPVARMWGLRVCWFFRYTQPEPLTAVAIPVQQVNLTVIHVQAGAVLSVGGVILDPRITRAIPQRDAITEGNQE